MQAPAEIDAVDDIAPLIRPAHLQDAAMAAIEFDEVVSRQYHVVEFKKQNFWLPLQPQFHGIVTEHAIDRKMPADIAEEIDIVERIEPVGIVGHDCVVSGLFARRVGKTQETRKDRTN